MSKCRCCWRRRNPKRDLRDCVVETFNILEAMRRLNLKNIIFSSTGAVYAIYV